MALDRRSFVAAALAMLPAMIWSSAALGASAASVHVVHLNKMKFGPAPDGAKVGDTIEWVNDDILRHTATAKNGAFDVDLKPHGKARVVLKTPGEIVFYCRYHPGMTGRLVVAPKDP
jgi:plastocyanin